MPILAKKVEKSEKNKENPNLNFYVPFNSLKSPAFFSYKQIIKVFQGVDLVSSQNSFKNAILDSERLVGTINGN